MVMVVGCGRSVMVVGAAGTVTVEGSAVTVGGGGATRVVERWEEEEDEMDVVVGAGSWEVGSATGVVVGACSVVVGFVVCG